MGIFFLSFSGKTVYITAGTKAFRIKSNGIDLTCVPELALHSNQEEADTKAFLCASFASDLGFEKVRIVTVDSDMGILALYHQQQIQAKLLLEIGTGSNLKILDISSHTFSKSLIDALPGLHAFSGCDTTSSFNGIGKVKCLSTLQSESKYIKAMANIGEAANLDPETILILEEYVCRLYSIKNCNQINKAR